LEGGPPCFPQDFPCPAVLKVNDQSLSPFAYRTVTSYGGPFQEPSARGGVSYSVPVLDQAIMPYNPLKA
jgi:hypothetical protein